MEMYVIGTKELTPLATQCRNIVDFLKLGVIDTSVIIVCSSSDLVPDFIQYLTTNTSAKAIVLGMDVNEKILKLLPTNVYFMPHVEMFGSTKYLFDKFENKLISTKGMFRFISRDIIDEEINPEMECYQQLSSLLFLLMKYQGPVERKYHKAFKKDGFYRLVFLVKMKNGSVSYIEQTYASETIPSKYWEYGVRGSLIVSDSLKELPLLSYGRGSFQNFNDFRLNGTIGEIYEELFSRVIDVSSLIKTDAFLKEFTELSVQQGEI